MILVTGAAGLVGSELIKQLLAQGQQVRALYHTTSLSNNPHLQLQPFQCDILDITGLELAMEGVEKVYHCAAMVNFNPAQKKRLFKVNIEGTTNVVNAALVTGVKKLVHVSSVAALGRIRENEPINEKMNWTEETSNSNYGQSKYLSELEVWRGIGEGLNAVMVNPVIILGAGDWHAGSSQIFKSVYDEFPWYTEGITGFVDVSDVATIMIALMNSDITAERFILSAGNFSYREIFNMVADAFGKKQPHKKVTPFIAQLVWRIEKIKTWFTHKNPLVTKETAATALAHSYFDNSKLLQFLPGFQYKPMATTIADTCAVLGPRFSKN